MRIAVDLQFVDLKWDHKQYSVMCPVDSLFKMANNTVLRGEYVQPYRANTIVVIDLFPVSS